MEPVAGEACVRVGAVYSLAIRTYARTAAWPQALRLLDDMAARGVDAATFLDAATLSAVYAAGGRAAPAAAAPRPPADEDGASVVSEVDSL